MRFYSKSFLFFTDLFCKRKNKVNTRKKILIRNPFKNKNYVSGGGGVRVKIVGPISRGENDIQEAKNKQSACEIVIQQVK